MTQAEVRSELWERRTLLKSWTLRGTLHLHAADELPLWTGAARSVDRAWYERYDLDAAQGAAVLDAIAQALDGRCLLREELADEVDRRVGAWAGERVASGWGFLIGEAAAAGKLCHGPPQGTKVTFVRPDQWHGSWQDVDLDEALAEACRRYLATYGPAGPGEFSQWFAGKNFKVADARRLFESLADELEEVDVEGRAAWFLARDAAVPKPPRKRSLRLLPEYDCYVMGFRERERFVPEAAREQLKGHPRGRFEGLAGVPALLIDGVVAGLWRRVRRGNRIEIQVESLRRLSADERELLQAEADRIGAFLDAETELELGSLST